MGGVEDNLERGGIYGVVVNALRRQSHLFLRGEQQNYRGVQVRSSDNKPFRARHAGIHIAAFGSDKMAGGAYDMASVVQDGRWAWTNFQISNYVVEGNGYKTWAVKNGVVGELVRSIQNKRAENKAKKAKKCP